jgi:hypothetical protein
VAEVEEDAGAGREDDELVGEELELIAKLLELVEGTPLVEERLEIVEDRLELVERPELVEETLELVD